ncbi:type I addiction module toxin, SymE family [Candidatus Bathyarchaeota archaeon]|nr:type I addiction module toxin, SymE family [Candidatus Bathyarchaeota archaeon]
MASKPRKRNLKVYYQPSHSALPMIRLQGQWLQKQAGFSPGDRIVVHIQRGRLVIRKVPKQPVRY